MATMSEVPHYSWSFSSLGLLECPKKYEIIRAKKLIAPQSSAAGDEGSRLHEVIEDYVCGGIWSDELKDWKQTLDVYKAKGGVCEEEFAFKWERFCKYPYDGADPICEDKLVRTTADDPEAWYRGYLDWYKIDGDSAEIVDWKTGRVKLTKQLQLYAWILMTAYPQVNKVKCIFHFLKFKDQISEWYERNDMEKLFKPFQDQLDEINNWYRTDTWPAIPGPIVKKTGRGAHCTYCNVTKEYCSEGL